MNRHLISLLLTGTLCASSMSASSPVYYGFSPKTCAEDNLSAIGSGANAFMEAAIRLDPSVDPLVAKLQGHRIIGVRCYLRADYKQKSKGFSCVKAYTGGLEDKAVSKTVNFLAGWNEVMFDEPIEIGQTPVYVGYQVYETQGEPYPLAAYKDAQVPGVCYINPGRKGWIEDSSRGTLMIEAIIDADESLLDGHVLVAPFAQPLIVAPGTDFSCSLYVHNQSARPVSDIVYTSRDAEGNVTASHSLKFDEPLPPYGSYTLTGALGAPLTEGSSVTLLTEATEIDGDKADGCMASPLTLYVSSDVFHRVPLVEEFTGLRCTNCPFMFYYLDMALEAYAKPHVYVSHHAGYSDDVLTKPCDKSLLYLFGPDGSYNPAVMYDRRIMQGRDVPVLGATSELGTAQYDSRIAEAMGQPALAKVLVESEVSADKASCRVYGKISKAALDFKDDLYITAYLLEDDIPAKGRLHQSGLDEIPEDAPDDLLERFRHRGVIRHCFSTGDNGDRLPVDAEGNFEVSFADISPESAWNLDECEAVAFVHKVNAADLADNYVLNAGAVRFNEYAQTGTVGVAAPAAQALRILVTPSGRILPSEPDAVLDVYTLSGIRCDPAAELPRGIYIVRWQRSDNTSGVCKLSVK